MNKDTNKGESGINPVHSTGEKGDIYFTNGIDLSGEHRRPTGSGSASSTVRKKKPGGKKSGGVKSTYMFFIIVIAVSMLLSVYAVFCMNDIFAITKTSSTVTVNVADPIESSSEAVDILKDNGLIKCPNFCKFFANYRSGYVGGPYESGVYYLYGKMGLEGMLQTLQGESQTKETITLTFPEGYTVPEIMDKLVENDVCDRTSLLGVISSTDFSYSLVKDLKANENVPYRLEGYMFPDTYEFFIGENASSAVRKFLSNGDSKITQEERDKAAAMGYSMNDIITIASIIQMEAGSNDQMKTISSIIHNRLSDSTNFPSLGCQSTSDYITNKVAPSLSSTSAHTSEYYMNYYNTNNDSTVVGLPAGPICNPGADAIKAALNPKESSNYYFFHDTKGTLYTAKTYAEFKEKINMYAPYLNF